MDPGSNGIIWALQAWLAPGCYLLSSGNKPLLWTSIKMARKFLSVIVCFHRPQPQRNTLFICNLFQLLNKEIFRPDSARLGKKIKKFTKGILARTMRTALISVHRTKSIHSWFCTAGTELNSHSSPVDTIWFHWTRSRHLGQLIDIAIDSAACFKPKVGLKIFLKKNNNSCHFSCKAKMLLGPGQLFSSECHVHLTSETCWFLPLH